MAAGGIELLSSSYIVAGAWRNLDLPQQHERLKRLLSALTVVPEPDVALPCRVPLLPAAIRAGATHLVRGDRARFGPYRAHTLGGVLVCMPGDYLMSLRLPQ